MKQEIVVVGSIALDSVETPFGKKEEVLGGSTTYFSYAASFFSKVNLVGVVGEDFPQEHIELLHGRNIDTQGLTTASGKTFRWNGSYLKDLNNAQTLSVALNVFENFKPTLPESYKKSGFVFLANIDPELQLEVLNQVDNPALTVCDTMNLWIETRLQPFKKLLSKVDILILNDGEAKMLTRETNITKASKLITQLGPDYVVIKKGEHGALLYSEKISPHYFIIPAFPLEKVVDPTGAGDSFAGGFVGYLAQAKETSPANIKKAMLYGTILASFNVEDFSLERFKRLNQAEIEARVSAFEKIIAI